MDVFLCFYRLTKYFLLKGRCSVFEIQSKCKKNEPVKGVKLLILLNHNQVTILSRRFCEANENKNAGRALPYRRL